MRVLRGVVYMTKSSGPRTEPWGTKQEDVYQEDRSVSHLTRKQRDDRYDEPAENRAMDTKPGGETSDQDVMVNSVKSSREVK